MKLKKILNKILIEKVILGRDTVIPLSAIDQDFAELVVKSGLKDGQKTDDQVDSNVEKKFKVEDLRPAQTELVFANVIGMCLNNILGGDNKMDLSNLGAIVSNDSNPYIMDGHHRWAAAYLKNPKSEITATQVDLPGPALLSLLNIISKGKLGVTKGNKGTGNIKNFNAQSVISTIKQLLENGNDYMSSDQVKQALKQFPGANSSIDNAVRIIASRANSLPKDIMPGAVSRQDMPVISPSEIDIVVNLLNSGEVDFKEPHSTGVKLNKDTGIQ